MFTTGVRKNPSVAFDILSRFTSGGWVGGRRIGGNEWAGEGDILIEQTTSEPLPPRRDENRINKTTLTRRRRCITSSVCQQQTAQNA